MRTSTSNIAAPLTPSAASASRASSLRSRLPRLGVGCGSLALADGGAALPSLVREALCHGRALFDTAPLYLGTGSESALGRALAGLDRGSFLLSSKSGRYRSPDAARPSRFDYGFDATLRSVEASLRRLGSDRLDLSLIHDLDEELHGAAYPERFREALAGSVRALDRLKSEGVIGATGCATMSWRSALRFCEATGADVVMLAGQHTLLDREAGPLLDRCLAHGTVVLAASPYNGGLLARGSGSGAPYNFGLPSTDILARVDRMDATCRAFGVPLAAAAIQHPLRHPAVATVVVGSASDEELRANLRLLATPIPPDLWQALDLAH